MPKALKTLFLIHPFGESPFLIFSLWGTHSMWFIRDTLIRDIVRFWKKIRYTDKLSSKIKVQFGPLNIKYTFAQLLWKMMIRDNRNENRNQDLLYICWVEIFVCLCV